MKRLGRFFGLLALPLALGAPLLAQLSTMEQIPTPRQVTPTTTGKVVAYGANVVSGDTLIAAFRVGGTCATPTIADTLSTSWGSPVVSTTTAGLCFYVWIGSAPSSGADTVTVTSALTTSPAIQALEWTNLSTTVNATATANNNFVSQAANMPNITTSKYRALIIDFVECSNTDVIGPAVGSSYEPLAGTNLAIYSQFLIPTANPGTFSSSLTDVNNRTCSEAAIAIESTTSLKVSTPAIPDAVVNQSYSFQLGATGGVGTNSWSLTSGVLPAGLSLSSAGVISGTPTGTSTGSFTFQVTDGASATATASLSIHVAASANTAALVNHATGTSSATATVTSGNILIVGYSLSNNWQTNVITDTVGTSYVPVPGTALGMALGSASGVCRCFFRYYLGVANGSGSNTVTTGGSATELLEFSNSQVIFDTGVASVIYSQSGGATITSGSITAPVAETLFAVGVIGTAAGTIAINSPFTDNGNITFSGVRYDTGYEIGASTGSQTASWAVTGNTSNLWMAMLFGIRPTTSGTGPTSVRHKVKVY